MKHRYSVTALLAYPITGLLLAGCGAADPISEDTASQSAELKSAADTSAPSLDSLEKADMKAWHKSMTKTPLPHKGCFQAAHPSMEWKEVPCATPSADHPPVPHMRDARRRVPTSSPTPQLLAANTTLPQTVGGDPPGDEFVAKMTGITQVVGTFPFVSGLRYEDDNGVSSRFSLQINTNRFRITPGSTACTGSEACTNSKSPNCTCWQQFVFDNPTYPITVSKLYMQYWLIDYHVKGAPGPTCPDSSWIPWNDTDCYRNSNMSDVAAQPITNLPNLTLTAQANAGGIDYVIFGTGAGAINASAADSEMSLSQAWNSSEFNVFGDHDGTSAIFNSHVQIDVQQSVTNGTSARPSCVSGEGTTAETNNLSLVGNCCTSGGHPALLSGGTPGIRFTESNGNLGNPPDGPYCVSRSLDQGGSFPSDVTAGGVPGTAQDIGVGMDTAWIVDSGSYIQKWNYLNNSWQSSGRSGGRHIAVQSNGAPWYVDTSGNIFQGSSDDPATITWTQRAGCANDIGIGANGAVWIVGCSAVNGGYGMFKWGGSNWIMDTSGGGATRIAVDSAGTPWIVNSRYEIFQRTSTDPTTGGWHIYGGGAQAVDIGIGPAGYPWIIGTSATAGGYSIFGWDDVNNTWKPVWGGATQISVGANGRPWLVNDAGHIFRGATQ